MSAYDRFHGVPSTPAGARSGGREPCLEIAAGVVARVEATGEPADRVLRDELRRSGLAGQPGGEVARAVHAWFRWRGFFPRGRGDRRDITRALDLERRLARDPAGLDPVALARHAVPEWVAGELDVTQAWVRSLQAPPILWLRARRGLAGSVRARLHGAAPSPFPALADALGYDGRSDLYRTGPYREGLFEIQDIASQAVGIVCAPVSGETWWDACAGQGGKTLHLADLMQNRGLIWATDRSRARLEHLRRRAARAGMFNYRAVRWTDAGRPPVRTRFDGVLVDAPCSGLGTWARNPHARWTTLPRDVRELADVQTRLLATAAGSVKPGGRLVYAVCTLTRTETAAVADRFEAGVGGFAGLPFASPFAPESRAPRQVWWPQQTGGNGMFVAAWRRLSV